MLSNQRPTVPLLKHSSEINRQLLEVGGKLLGVEDSASKDGTYTPEGLWAMDNACWSRDTPESTAAHQCPRLELGHWGKGQQETTKHRAAEVVKHTVAEGHHHRYHLNFLHRLSARHRNFDQLSIIYSKNRENWDREVWRRDGSVCLNVYFLLFFFFFFKTAISNERFVFLCNKLFQLKFPDCRLFCPQRVPSK